MVKVKRKIFLSVISILILIFALRFFSGILISNNNYRYNLSLNYEISDIINSQNDYYNYKFGLFNIADNGCGVVSLYNILSLDNKPEKFEKIIKKLDRYGATAYGRLGTNPIVLIHTLKTYGYKTNIYFNINNFYENAKTSKYNIMVYINSKEGWAHYHLFYNYNSLNDTFTFINPSYTKTFDNFLNSITDCYKFLITIN